jgi:hypothetical protein
VRPARLYESIEPRIDILVHQTFSCCENSAVVSAGTHVPCAPPKSRSVVLSPLIRTPYSPRILKGAVSISMEIDKRFANYEQLLGQGVDIRSVRSPTEQMAT